MTTANRGLNPAILRLLTSIDDPSAIPATVATLQALRATSLEQSTEIDMLLLSRLATAQKGFKSTQENQKKLTELLKKMTEPPLFSAIHLGHLMVQGSRRARVLFGNNQRIVNYGPEVAHTDIHKGDEIFLNAELNIIVDKSPDGVPPFGETALFCRMTTDGVRMILEHRGGEIVVDVAEPMRQRDDLERGDIIRFDRTTLMAYEKIEREQRQDFLLDQLPDEVTAASIGGLDDNLETLLQALTASLIAPERAKAYGLTGRRAILMVGPPGCGKTLMARFAAAEMGRISGKECRFSVVKPGEFLNPYVGETERRIRECFEDLKDASESGLSVLFLDEIESSLGRIRGSMGGHHSDRFLSALLAEIDGFSSRENVAIICATNRKELIDPALLERLSETEIVVGRPDAEAARAIFEIHLPVTTPFRLNGSSAGSTRMEIIEAAVSRLYAPNADNGICTIRFRDGTSRSIAARELMSGRLISQTCMAARQSALSRELRNRDAKRFKVGVTPTDMQEALDNVITRMQTTVTRQNARAYLFDLPDDMDVVSVEPIRRKVTHDYTTIA